MGLFRGIELPTPVSDNGEALPPVNIPQLLGRFQGMADNLDILRHLTEVTRDEEYFRIIEDIREVRPISGSRSIIELQPVPPGVFWEVHRVIVALQTAFERGGASRAQANVYVGSPRDLRNYVGSAQCFLTAETESGTPGITFEPYHPIIVKDNERLSIEVAVAREREEPYVPAIIWGRVIKIPPQIIES